MARCAGANHWKDGQPTDDNPTFGGARYVDGKGWCNSQGVPLKMNTDYVPGSPSSARQSTWSNPNIPPGYKRVAMGVPCPIRGSENGVVMYEVKGKRALWDEGNVYMVSDE